MVKYVQKDKTAVKTNYVKSKLKKDESVASKVVTISKKKERKHTLHIQGVTCAVSALLQVITKIKDERAKSALFKDEAKEILLQVVPIKIPQDCKMELRTVLPHSLAIDKADVCLITDNVQKSTKDDNEPTIAHYKGLLQDNKIKNKIQIVPIRQLCSEHVSYELKGRFSDLYDMYLIDGRLYGKATKFLGSRFFKKSRHLIPVKLNTNKFKQEVEKGLATTAMSVHSLGDCYSTKVGYSHFSAEKIVENICAVADALANRFPGGFANIRKLLIKTHGTMAIPIFLSLEPANSVPVPVVRPHLPKAHKPVEGELTTILGGHVTVLPTGEVFLKHIKTQEDIEMFASPRTREPVKELSEGEGEEEEEDSEMGDKEDNYVVPEATVKKRKAVKDEESSDDDDLETAEDAYLQDLQNRQNQQVSDQKTNAKEQMEKKTTSNTKSKRKKGASTPKELQTAENNLMKKSPTSEKKKQKGGGTPATPLLPTSSKKSDAQENKTNIVEGKKKKSKKSASRYFSPKNVRGLMDEGVPVTEQKALIGKKQLKKSKLNLDLPDNKLTATSPQNSQKRMESGTTPKPKKLKGEVAVDVAVHSEVPVNGEAKGHGSPKKSRKNRNKDKKVPLDGKPQGLDSSEKPLQKKMKTKPMDKKKKSKSPISSATGKADASFTRYFSKENKKK